MQDKYTVKLYPKALRDLDGIYEYIFAILQAPEHAVNQLERLELKLFTLEENPYRCAERRKGIYANRGYRELLVDNYVVIYKIDEKSREVHIMTVQYSGRNK